ncbi:Ig-like domain-containing protein [Corallococcus sp. bb12-1]|uniref:Ig-like domain-containing protein n=1 Tax=Corallococcus sp. bb12-1 TaxID=2996784 RepID=UPI00226F83E1|nr:Ig-like domain-containing protein [Corallococcus sp. bb12-1]MCY1041451.1 Ig-like domain-containing protein [Corallococcus sp. bb12-1]
MSLPNPPAGIQLQPATLSSGETRAQLSIGIGTSTAAGTYSLTIQGRSGAVTKQATLGVTVGKAGDLVVNWVVPTPGKAYTRGPLLLQFAVEGGSAEAVEILKDSSVLAKPTGAPFSFTWDTTQEAEGTYQLSVRATRGGATFISAPRTVVVDRTAPTVSSFLPARNAAAVGVNESIQVTFSEPMNPRTLTEESVQLTASDSAPISKSISLSADGKTVSVTPLEPLVAPNTIHVEFTNLVGTVITDLAGNEVVEMPAWSFSVPTWVPLGGAVSAVPGKTSAEGVVLKMDLNGQPVIAWAESDGTVKNIYVARWTGSNWLMLGAPLSGLVAAGTDAANPSLAIDSANQPIVVWDEATGEGMGRRLFVRKWAGNTWNALPSIPIVSSSEQLAKSAQLLIDANDNLIVHAIEQNPNNGIVMGFKLPTGGIDWIDLHPAQPANHFQAGSLSVAAAGSNVFTAYTAYDDATSRRAVVVLPNDAPPLGGIAIGQSTYTPTIAVDMNARPWLAWVQSNSSDALSDGSISWALWEGTQWSTPAVVSSASTGNAHPSIALGVGSPHVLAWSGVLGSERSILVRQWVDDTWKPLGGPLSALTTAGTPAFAPSVAMDRSARPVIAWTESDATAASVYVYQTNH